MRTGTWNALLLSLVITASGCSSMDKTEKGAAIGAGAGAAVGAVAGGAKGAAIGAVAGGVTGAVIGDHLEKRRKELARIVPTQKTEDGLKVTLPNDLLFSFNEADLKSSATAQLEELAGVLGKYPKDRLRVMGHADRIGKTEYNQQLSEDRAESVKEFLQSHGVKERQITALGRGETQARGTTESSRQKDRRVDIFIEVAPPEA